MKTPQKSHPSKDSGHYQEKGTTRRAVGYIRVSTDMQADGRLVTGGATIRD